MQEERWWNSLELLWAAWLFLSMGSFDSFYSEWSALKFTKAPQLHGTNLKKKTIFIKVGQ